MPGSDPVDSLVLDLLEWIGAEPRPYAEVLEAWRTSCPQLPVWEEANARGFIKRHRSIAGVPLVSVTASGAHHLRSGRSGRVSAS
jgi:D-3-phosphoglycerate dehydrogenase / 2-oxoglutarate reductase